jgi:hypothetical protein
MTPDAVVTDELAAPLYSRMTGDLPAVYQTDAVSFGQIDAYLGIVDDLNRAYIERLEHLATWLSPDATALWPAGQTIEAGGDAVLAAYDAIFDELASWFAFQFPASWNDPARVNVLHRKRSFLERAARFWRRRGTPSGFIDWVCFAFGIDPTDRPYLLEHFKYSQQAGAPPPDFRATLLVPDAPQFRTFDRRREFEAFIATSAPAHVHVRICFVDPAFTLPAPSPSNQAAIAKYDSDVSKLLCELVSVVDYSVAIRALDCNDEGEARDALGIGTLPTTGTDTSFPDCD